MVALHCQIHASFFKGVPNHSWTLYLSMTTYGLRARVKGRHGSAYIYITIRSVHSSAGVSCELTKSSCRWLLMLVQKGGWAKWTLTSSTRALNPGSDPIQGECSRFVTNDLFILPPDWTYLNFVGWIRFGLWCIKRKIQFNAISDVTFQGQFLSSVWNCVFHDDDAHTEGINLAKMSHVHGAPQRPYILR